MNPADKPPFSPKKRVKPLALLAVAVLGVYVATYVVLARKSGYHYVITRSSPQRDELGVFVTHLHQWGPRFACQTFETNGTLGLRPNLLGRAFAPLFFLDRMVVHESKEIIATPTGGTSVVGGYPFALRVKNRECPEAKLHAVLVRPAYWDGKFDCVNISYYFSCGNAKEDRRFLVQLESSGEAVVPESRSHAQHLYEPLHFYEQFPSTLDLSGVTKDVDAVIQMALTNGMLGSGLSPANGRKLARLILSCSGDKAAWTVSVSGRPLGTQPVGTIDARSGTVDTSGQIFRVGGMSPFASKEVPYQRLTNLLWAVATGKDWFEPSHPGLSAFLQQGIDIYVLLKDGTYLYDARSNGLKLILAKDLRGAAQAQEYPPGAPVILVLVADPSRLGDHPDAVKRNIANVNAGDISYSIYQSSMPEDLETAAGDSLDRKVLSEKLNLPAGQWIIVSQAVGYCNH
jgi:hypothetical protein